MPESYAMCSCGHMWAGHADDGCRAWGHSPRGLTNCPCRGFHSVEPVTPLGGVLVKRVQGIDSLAFFCHTDLHEPDHVSLTLDQAARISALVAVARAGAQADASAIVRQ